MSENSFKWIVSVMCGFTATFFQQYGLFIFFVAVAVSLDFITGIVKAKATDTGLDSRIASKGFWKKISLFVALIFGIFLDYVIDAVLIKTGINFSVGTPFTLIIACYIIINECISIAENLYLINPHTLPKWIANVLKIAKDDIDNQKDTRQ